MASTKTGRRGWAQPELPGLRLLGTDEVAEMLGIKAATVRSWRVKGCGPDYFRIGAQVRYDARAVEAWVRAQAVSPR